MVALLNSTPSLLRVSHPPMDSAAFSRWWGDSAEAGKGSQTCVPLYRLQVPRVDRATETTQWLRALGTHQEDALPSLVPFPGPHGM